MVNKQLRPAASFLLFLNLCMYGVVLGLSGWAMNRIINYGTVGGGQNGATLYLIIFSLVAGVVGAVSCLFGLNHVTYWAPDSLPAAAAAAAIAWSLTMLALGFASKHIRLHTNSEHLKALEAFIIILSGTMLLYIGAIHGAIKRGEEVNMVNKQLRPAASCLLFLNFCMYIVVLAISGWAMNKFINHGNVGGGENAATLYFILFSLISGTVGAVSCSFGLNHISEWGPESLPAAAAAATIAWSLTILALGFACKHIKLETNNQQLKTLEAFIIILSATMGMYIGSIHGAIKRAN